MPEGPLGGPRPFVSDTAEVNVFLNEAELTEADITPVKVIVGKHKMFGDQVSGPVGARRNVITTETRDNTANLNSLKELENRINSQTEYSVENIEVIF